MKGQGVRVRIKVKNHWLRGQITATAIFNRSDVLYVNVFLYTKGYYTLSSWVQMKR